jgi:DNA repair exonuclease SbcCD ATPase subunit
MRLVSLSVQNILSIEDALVSFPENGLILVEGWNHDTESANGAGKTAMFNALSWCLFDEYPRGVSITDFIRHGTKESSVAAELEIGGKILKVKRHRPKKFHAELDGTEISESEFYNTLPLSYEQFILAQYFAQGLGQRFLDLNDSGRKDLILKLMRAEGFVESRKQVDTELKGKLLEQSKAVSEIENLKARISAYQESVTDAGKLNLELSKLEAAIKETTAKINKLSKIEKPESIDKHVELIDKLNVKLRDISVSNGKLRAYRQQLKDLNSQPEPEDYCDGVCPSCQTELDLVDGSMKVHDKSSHVAKIAAYRANIKSKQDALTAAIKTAELEVSKEDAILSTISSVKQKIKDANQEYEDSQRRIIELKSFIKQKISEKQGISSVLEKQEALAVKISAAKKQIETIETNAVSISERIELLQTISQILSPVGVPAYVMDAVIQGLNDRIQDVIQLVWPNSYYELLAFKENKSGSVTSKMSDSLTVDGVKRPLGSLSGGERRCLSLAIDFALADIVSRYTGADLNPLILDEPFDHLDAANRAKVVDLLREMSQKRCIVVIDHASEAKAMFDRSITVTKRNGISTINDEIIN